MYLNQKPSQINDAKKISKKSLLIFSEYISNEFIGDITPNSFTTLVGIPPQPSTPYLVNNVLFWNQTSGVNGPILFYIIWMNQTDIYNGDYLEEGIDLIPFMEE